MFDLDFLQEIWNTISRNKLRSFLTGFGVFWGIFMLIILIGVSNAFKGSMGKLTEGFSTNSCFFWSGLTEKPYKGFQRGRSWHINNHDLELIRQKAKSAQYISPVIFGASSSKNVTRKHKAGSFQVKGAYPEKFLIERPDKVTGRLINDLDIKEERKVCIIGRQVAKTLFDDGESVLGENIRVNGIYFQVVGIIDTNPNIGINGSDNRAVILPFSTMQKTFNLVNLIHFLACTTKPGIGADRLEDEVKAILKTAHSIAPDDDKAVSSFNIEKIAKTFDSLLLGVDFIAFFVGLGALFSGIIGISNIMMVTIKERTREIGVRRALGASPASIVRQIVGESLVLTTFAGIIGFMGAVAVLFVADKIVENMGEGARLFVAPSISFHLALWAMFILAASGILAGLLPALHALHVKAIEAIRDE